MDKKESEVEEAKAIIAQRSGNPREFFKQKERAMTISVDTSPVSIHRTGKHFKTHSRIKFILMYSRLDSPFLRQQHSPSSPSPTPPPRGASPLRTPPPHARTQPAAAAGSVAPQARDSSGFSVWGSGTDSLVNLWDSSSAPPADPSQTSQSSNLVDLMGDADDSLPSATAATASGRPQPLLSFDEMMDGTFCSSTGAEDDPSSLVDVTGSDQMTLSYQHALQHASSDGQELDDGQLLMTNGETLLKEGTQVRQVNAAAMRSETDFQPFHLLIIVFFLLFCCFFFWLL
uniref:Drebrin 1 n=1 Tax=Lates calcarifer TaxID=8187 RepID=A0A4W6G7X0_LATCA